jgi:CRISPR-associated endonuclease/helicase Cas3
MDDFPSFPAFYRAANSGRSPFPWQARLAEQVTEQGWPAEIGVPTGLGKTACIDIAVWALAASAAKHGHGRLLPTRIWYVVNRRLLVDAAWDRGKCLAELLDQPESLTRLWSSSGPEDVANLSAVAESLRSLAAFDWKAGPLTVLRLRGGADLATRPPDPSQPALVLATVPMFASRWLFRGYGSSRSMRPVDAALAGTDSLVLLDEAHLSGQLAALAGPKGPLACCDVGSPETVLAEPRCRPLFVALTATGRSGERFDLDGADLRDPTVRQRLYASKLVAATAASGKDLPRRLAAHAVELLDRRGAPSSCVVFANTPRTARAVTEYLRPLLKSRPGACLLLLTGRVREAEAQRLREEILGPHGAAAGRAPGRTHDLVVVATQTLEVGADVDFECLVTESAGARAIVQRLGRLNRLGAFSPGISVVCHPEGEKPSPLYGAEAEEVWRRIAEAAGGGEVDLAPAVVGDVVGVPADEPKRVGELLPAHLWEWAKTSQPARDEAPVELFFEGFDEGGDVSVVWRARIPGDDQRLVPWVRAPESIDVPIWELQEVLSGAKVERVTRLQSDRERVEEVPIESLRAGDDVILPVGIGLYDELGWNPSSSAEVLDVSPIASGILVLDEGLIRNLVRHPSPECLAALRRVRASTDEDPDSEPLDPADEALVQNEFLESLKQADPHPWMPVALWRELLSRPGPSVVRSPSKDPYMKWARGQKPGWGIRSDVFEELSFGLPAGHLAEHLRRVEEVARRMAVALGLRAELVHAVALAGRLHDLGKLDARFQRWLRPQAGEGEALAKSDTPREFIEASRIASGWPKWGRHELLSGRIAGPWLATQELDCDRDLVLHLILSHHGGGRPLVGVVGDNSQASFSAQVGEIRLEASANLSIPEWDQPRRFRLLCERYGYWGLAFLEAFVRQADHAVSSVKEVN